VNKLSATDAHAPIYILASQVYVNTFRVCCLL